jgi:uncharacterized protein (TIGR02453 family)
MAQGTSAGGAVGTTGAGSPGRKPFFTRRLFDFLRELEANNSREWFADNKQRYEHDVRDAAFEFIAAFSHPLHEISRQFLAVPRATGGSLFRIHRDVRFSGDKSPYKTHVGIHFRHRNSADAHAPGFYLHLEPGDCFAGVGIWRPDGETTRRIRQAIAAPRSSWARAVGGDFARRFELAGEQLVRAPRGFDPAHKWVDDLRRKSFLGLMPLRQGDVVGGGFLDQYVEICRAGAPLNRFLCRALEVPF